VTQWARARQTDGGTEISRFRDAGSNNARKSAPVANAIGRPLLERVTRARARDRPAIKHAQYEKLGEFRFDRRRRRHSCIATLSFVTRLRHQRKTDRLSFRARFDPLFTAAE